MRVTAGVERRCIWRAILGIIGGLSCCCKLVLGPSAGISRGRQLRCTVRQAAEVSSALGCYLRRARTSTPASRNIPRCTTPSSGTANGASNICSRTVPTRTLPRCTRRRRCTWRPRTGSSSAWTCC
uniref:(northern house mosquito) hypothetical protein n=1 Tax=Culex pipiens TaxID=7175 RepID=A0A8D8KJG4_CULPI